MKVSPSSGLCSLPDDVAVTCLAQISRFDLAALATASKSHRALVSSPELSELRRRMGCIETCLYVCMRISGGNPRWFVLNPQHRRLNPIPSNPNQAPESSSFVAVDGGIYVLGGLINCRLSSDVWFLDCFSHTWNRVPSMRRPRVYASANLVDGKIYVCGGCREEADSTNWAEVFDLKTQTWGTWFLPKIKSRIWHSVVIEEEKRVYGVDVEGDSFHLLPSKRMFFWRPDLRRDFFSRNKDDWCAIGKLLFCRAPFGTILWCDPNELRWKQVKGLEEHCDNIDICRLCTNSAGNIVIFWISSLVRQTWLCSAEISLRRKGGEIWGKVEWSDTVFKLDDILSSGFKVLYSASVLVSPK